VQGSEEITAKILAGKTFKNRTLHKKREGMRHAKSTLSATRPGKGAKLAHFADLSFLETQSLPSAGRVSYFV
jgi:hypothetical protein